MSCWLAKILSGKERFSCCIQGTMSADHFVSCPGCTLPRQQFLRATYSSDGAGTFKRLMTEPCRSHLFMSHVQASSSDEGHSVDHVTVHLFLQTFFSSCRRIEPIMQLYGDSTSRGLKKAAGVVCVFLFACVCENG